MTIREFSRNLKYVVVAAMGGIVKFSVPLLVPEVTRHLFDNVFLNSALDSQQKLGELVTYVGGMLALFLFVWAPWTYVPTRTTTATLMLRKDPGARHPHAQNANYAPGYPAPSPPALPRSRATVAG